MPLINSDNWKAAFVSLKQLSFHPANPRLPELGNHSSAREIIHEMCTRAKIEVLARAIAEKGYFRNDRLIVLKEDSKHIVYEGNRRLCALKVLAEPDLVPAPMQKTFKRLAERAQIPNNMKVAVEIVPTKFDAEVVMYSKHSPGQFMLGWEPIQQAAFISAKLHQGESIEDVCRSYALKRDEVLNARAAVDLYRLSRLSQLTPEAAALIDDPGQFPYSTVFERLFKPKKSREALGAEITERGLVLNATEQAFLPVLGRILDDAAKGKIDTRKLNDETSQTDYAKSLGLTLGGGTLTADEAEARRRGQTPQSPTVGKPVPVKSASRPLHSAGRLFPSSLVLQHDQEKLRQLLKEGRKMEIETYPHAAACLLRATLECALTVRLKAQRLYGRVPVANKKHGASLADMLDYVNQNTSLFNLDPHAINALQALTSRKIKESKPQLDRIVHIPEVIAFAQEVVSIREQALPLLREIFHLPK